MHHSTDYCRSLGNLISLENNLLLWVWMRGGGKSQLCCYISSLLAQIIIFFPVHTPIYMCVCMYTYFFFLYLFLYLLIPEAACTEKGKTHWQQGLEGWQQWWAAALLSVCHLLSDVLLYWIPILNEPIRLTITSYISSIPASLARFLLVGQYLYQSVELWVSIHFCHKMPHKTMLCIIKRFKRGTQTPWSKSCYCGKGFS